MWDSGSEDANQVRQCDMVQSRDNCTAVAYLKAAGPRHALQCSHTHHALYENPR